MTVHEPATSASCVCGFPPPGQVARILAIPLFADITVAEMVGVHLLKHGHPDTLEQLVTNIPEAS